MNFTLRKLWDLRGELTNALLSSNYNRIVSIKKEYQALVENEKTKNFSAFTCYNHAFWTDAERDGHVLANMDVILKNIEAYENRYILGETDTSTKMKKDKDFFLAGEIWVLREMFDKFTYTILQKNQSGYVRHENMILGRAIIDRLIEIVNLNKNNKYNGELIGILRDVRLTYEEFYGKEQPKTSYSQIVKDYMSL